VINVLKKQSTMDAVATAAAAPALMNDQVKDLLTIEEVVKMYQKHGTMEKLKANKKKTLLKEFQQVEKAVTEVLRQQD
jgi:hypothetical protein